MDSVSHLIGKRLKLAREGSSRTQDELAAALGLKDRQSVSAIEVGERKVTPGELIKAADYLGKPLTFFTDPYIVAESNAFSYRARTLDSKSLEDFAKQAEGLIAALRRFRILLEEPVSPVHPQLRNVSKSTSFSLAAQSGEQTAASWELGAIPALRLRDVAEEKLGVGILYVDAPNSISGAACRLDDGDVILINRNEPEGRRNFNIGHEIFHLLTWETMPPEQFDLEPEKGDSRRARSEILADCYSGGLLMPSSIVGDRWQQKQESNLAEWLSQHSAELRVSRSALYWRLVNLGLINKDEQPLPSRGASKVASSCAEFPRLYNRAFVERLQKVLTRGHISVIRALEILECSFDQLVELFHSYQLEVPFGY